MRKNQKRLLFRELLSLNAMKSKISPLLVTFMLLVPLGVKAQQQQVTINLANVKIQEVFKEINKQTGLNFIYSADQLEALGLVTLNVKEITVNSALSHLFSGTDFTYKFTDKTVIVRKNYRRERSY